MGKSALELFDQDGRRLETNPLLCLLIEAGFTASEHYRTLEGECYWLASLRPTRVPFITKIVKLSHTVTEQTRYLAKANPEARHRLETTLVEHGAPREVSSLAHTLIRGGRRSGTPQPTWYWVATESKHDFYAMLCHWSYSFSTPQPTLAILQSSFVVNWLDRKMVNLLELAFSAIALSEQTGVDATAIIMAAVAEKNTEQTHHLIQGMRQFGA